jgi:hypothetical protein
LFVVVVDVVVVVVVVVVAVVVVVVVVFIGVVVRYRTTTYSRVYVLFCSLEKSNPIKNRRIRDGVDVIIPG